MDLLTKEEFEAGFGSHTPMYTGQTKCVRYYMNFSRGLDLFRSVALQASPCAGLPSCCVCLAQLQRGSRRQAVPCACQLAARAGAGSCNGPCCLAWGMLKCCNASLQSKDTAPGQSLTLLVLALFKCILCHARGRVLCETQDA